MMIENGIPDLRIKTDGPMRIYIGGLVGKFERVTEEELRELFEPFGTIDFVDIHKEPKTGKCKGFAFI